MRSDSAANRTNNPEIPKNVPVAITPAYKKTTMIFIISCKAELGLLFDVITIPTLPNTIPEAPIAMNRLPVPFWLFLDFSNATI